MLQGDVWSCVGGQPYPDRQDSERAITNREEVNETQGLLHD